MAGEARQPFRHFVLAGVTRTSAYQPRAGGGKRGEVPPKDRPRHAARLRADLAGLQRVAKRRAEQAAELERDEALGLQVVFRSFPGVALAFESLAREASGIEVLNVQEAGGRLTATVLVPPAKLNLFEKKITAYVEHRRKKDGTANDNRPLIDAIEAIREATLSELWTDTSAAVPAPGSGPGWWEVWLPVRANRRVVLERFQGVASLLAVHVAAGVVEFPERTVALVRATPEQMGQLATQTGAIAELRRPRETASFFDELPLDEQRVWVDELQSRLRLQAEGAACPHVCLLDTGVNRGHPLLQGSLAAADIHTVAEGGTGADETGHGTAQAGTSLFGDLVPVLEGSAVIELTHRLESVQVLRRDRAEGSDPVFHALLTEEAVSRPVIAAPARQRVYALALSAEDARDRGRPTAWSAALDALASDAASQGERPSLFVVAGGNVDGEQRWREYPAANETDDIHDPGQAWNALTVSAFTEKGTITEVDRRTWQPRAPVGALSPFASTSLTWPDRHTPLKPDIVFEGGNVAWDGATRCETVPSLMLLTTAHQPNRRLLTTHNATSAATAQAARMAAQIMATYPELWPEAVRALLVHSAVWTPAMVQAYAGSSRVKKVWRQLVQRVGFGVPDLDRALWSVDNSLTLVVQQRMQPFRGDGAGTPTLREMHLHELPWPVQALQALGETSVELRATLSYFVEPSPSRRGLGSKYTYPSHGLRFDARRPLESTKEFEARLNALARTEELGTTGPGTHASDDGWVLGPTERHRGSLHADVWRGRAADLAARGLLAVFPTSGWWRTRPHLGSADRAARYALIVSIRAPEIDVDLRTEIESMIRTPIETKGA